jgi:hypothetical protein
METRTKNVSASKRDISCVTYWYTMLTKSPFHTIIEEKDVFNNMPKDHITKKDLQTRYSTIWLSMGAVAAHTNISKMRLII